MGSIGFSRSGSGAGYVPPLQRAWVLAIQNTLQAHDDKLDALKDVAEGTAAGVAQALRWPVRIVCGAAIAVGASALGLLAIRILEVIR